MAMTMNCFSELFRNGMTMDEARKILDAVGAKLVARWNNLYGFHGSEQEENEFYVFAGQPDTVVGETIYLAGDDTGNYVATPLFDASGHLRYLRFEWNPGFGYSFEEYKIYRLPTDEPEFLLWKDDIFYRLTIYLPSMDIIRLREYYDERRMNYAIEIYDNKILQLIFVEHAEKPWFFDEQKLKKMIEERGSWQTLGDILEYLVKPVVSLLGDRQ